MTPEQLQTLRIQLPPFSSPEEGGETPLLQEFCRFYSLAFSARQPAITHRAGTIVSGRHTLAVHRWCQDDARANLFVVHGYFDHTGLFSKLIAWGLAHHCNVVAFDLPGHGLSSGEPAVIDDFGDYSRAIADVLAAVTLPELPLWVMGQSTGGAALIDLAGYERWPFAATVLLAPLIRPVSWRAISIAQRLLSPIVDSIPRTFAVNSSDTDFLDFIKQDPLQAQQTSLRWLAALRRWLGQLSHRDLGVGPALIIQGDNDHTVAWRYNLPVLRILFPGSTEVALPGAGHQLANESDEYREKYFSEVIRFLRGVGIELD